jgi:hypothetical protein
MSPGIVFVIVSIVVLSSLNRLGAEAPRGRLQVRVYDCVGLAADVRRAALVTAAAIFASAAIDVTWVECHSLARGKHGAAAALARDPACHAVPDAGELLLRIVRSDSPFADDARVPLGDAVIEPNVRPGGIATVYYSRVQWLARSADTHLARLLGRVMAHELGHLLLARTGHSEHGLMRGGWSRNDVRRSRVADWSFSEDEIAAIVTRLRQQTISAGTR